MNGMTIYGCARVSTDGQSVDAQVERLRAAGAAKVYRKTASGRAPTAFQLHLALAKLDAESVWQRKTGALLASNRRIAPFLLSRIRVDRRPIDKDTSGDAVGNRMPPWSRGAGDGTDPLGIDDKGCGVAGLPPGKRPCRVPAAGTSAMGQLPPCRPRRRHGGRSTITGCNGTASVTISIVQNSRIMHKN
jgi:hypothetical protein